MPVGEGPQRSAWIAQAPYASKIFVQHVSVAKMTACVTYVGGSPTFFFKRWRLLNPLIGAPLSGAQLF